MNTYLNKNVTLIVDSSAPPPAFNMGVHNTHPSKKD